MQWTPGSATAQRADRLDDLASALDAGLDAQAALSAVTGRGADLSDGLAAALGRTLPELDPASRAALEAAEAAGQLPDALREQAASDRAAAALRRQIALRLAYPAFVILMVTALAIFLAALGMPAVRPSFVVAWVATLALAGAAVRYVSGRARRDPGLDLGRLPLVGRLAGDAAAVTYLTAMRRGHRAGVAIDEAHRLAARACPLAHPRGRLVAATARLEERLPYVEALRSARALDEESLGLLEIAERTGDLEGAFARIAQRRRERLERDALRLGVLAGSTAYGLAVILVVWVALGFYSNLYSQL